MVTLPKDWAGKVGISKNSVVGLQPQPDGSLVIYPEGNRSTGGDYVKSIIVDDVDDVDFLYRRLVGAYISGMDIIELKSENTIPDDVIDIAFKFSHTAIGMEIMEEDDLRIVIEDLMDHKDIRPYKSVERMKVLTRNMMNDVLKCLKTRSVDVIIGMEIKDTEIDRLDWLISRQISILQRDVSLSRNMGANLSEISGCGGVSRCIERIGDHVVSVASSLTSLNRDDLSDLENLVSGISTRVRDIFTDSVSIWVDRDMGRANDCILECHGLVDKISKIPSVEGDANGRLSIALRTLSNSMKRAAEYSMDISEMTINSGMSKPDSMRASSR